jgi:manganese/iron transport system substrate-binding protein
MPKTMRRRQYYFIYALLWMASISMSFSGCGKQSQSQEGGKLKVLATTTLVADVVDQVGGDLIDLEILMPVGVDPHTFNPTPQDLTKLTQSKLVFLNGFGLEAFMEKYLDNLNGDVKLVEVSNGVKGIQVVDDPEHNEADPHTWTDPNNVKIWVENIVTALQEADPDNSQRYRDNADAYLTQLHELDAWIEAEVSQIAPEKRKIVSDHETLAYFAQRYGFKQIGTVIPGVSTLAEPSAQEIAQLEDLIQSENVPAIFVDTTVNPQLTERISKDVGVKVIPIYSGSLTGPTGEAGSYLEYMRYNVNAIVEALK